MAFPGKFHSRGSVFKVDNLGGALADISAYLDTFKVPRKLDRPQSATFGDVGERYGQVLGLKSGDLSMTGFYEPAAATKLHGRAAKIIISGNSMGPAFNKGKLTRKVKLDPTTTFGSGDVTYDVIGLMSGDANLSGYYAGQANDTEALLTALINGDPALGAALPMCSLGINGFAIGQMVELFSLPITDYAIDAGETKTLDLSLTGKADGIIDQGYSLHDLVQEVGAAPLSFTAVGPEAVSTTLGAFAVLQVSQFAGTTATVIIQTSPDNATWTTLVTFAAVTTAPGVQTVTVPVGTTVNTYLRAQISAATYTSMTFQVAIARRGLTSAMVTPGTWKHLAALFSNQYWIVPQAAYLWEYDPQGTAVTNPKKTGSCRLESLGITFDETQSLKFDMGLKVTGPVTDGFN